MNSDSGKELISQGRRAFTRCSMAALGGLGMGLMGCSPDVAPSPAQGANPNAAVPAMPPMRSSRGPAGDAGAYATQASGSVLEQIHKLVSSQMYGFGTGVESAAVGFHILVDPMCPHCGRTWVQSQALWDRFRFIWLPVPMLGPDSLTNGSLILGSADPVEAMNVHEHKLLNKLPPLNPVPSVIEQGRPQMEHNRRIAQQIRLDSVPLIMVQRADGEIISTSGGIGAKELAFLAGA